MPNPSFEDTVGCPSNYGDIHKAVGWQSLCASPDYYHECGSFGFTGVPNNAGGYQQAASGIAYAGLLSYIDSWPNGREFAAQNLLSPLIIGTKYFVSFKISLSLGSLIPSNCASDKLGAMFVMAPYSCFSLITNSPQVFTDSIVVDTVGWEKVFGSFIADSAYNYIVLGNFFDDMNTDIIKIYNDPQDNAYYFIDDVCVSTDSTFTQNFSYTGVEENVIENQIHLLTNPVKDILTIQNLLGVPIDLEVYNILGECLLKYEKMNNKYFEIDISNIPSGMILVNVKSLKNINTYKLIKL